MSYEVDDKTLRELLLHMLKAGRWFSALMALLVYVVFLVWIATAFSATVLFIIKLLFDIDIEFYADLLRGVL